MSRAVRDDKRLSILEIVITRAIWSPGNQTGIQHVYRQHPVNGFLVKDLLSTCKLWSVSKGSGPDLRLYCVCITCFLFSLISINAPSSPSFEAGSKYGRNIIGDKTLQV